MNDLVYPLVAIREDGLTCIADTPEEASEFNHLRPGPKHVEAYSYIQRITSQGAVWGESVTRWKWIVRDDAGRVVLHEDLPRFDKPRRGWFTKRLVAAQAAAERGLPIPGTGSRRRYSSGYRAFAVNISMRAAEAGLAADLDDWGVGHMNVGRRRSHRLPKVWDDVAYRSDRRCWKQHRSNRWR
jgi:hypothetical protein